MTGKKILVLGSGMVARPCVEYLVRNATNELTIGCRTLSAAQTLISGLPRTHAISIDVSNVTALDERVANCDLVISLVPYIYHAAVIKAAIKWKTHVVTTSYVSPVMRQLDDTAKEAGIVVLNEVGVDPGVDHLYAIKMIDEIHAKGGKVKKFFSYCGGLPAPEHAENPLGFKFSWSPRGALLSQLNSASYLSDGQQVDVSAQDLMTIAKPYYIADGYSFVAYPNRNSIPFRYFYNIPEADTIIRGSLRYEGNPQFIKALVELGWLDQEQKDWLVEDMTWAQIQQKTTDADNSSESALISRIMEICKFSSEAESERVISGLRWFGLLSSDRATVRGRTLMDTLCGQLEKLLSYQPGERDLVMLQHKIMVEWKDGKTDTLISTLELLGDPKGHSAMALSVGVTCGIAAQLLLDHHPAIDIPGIRAPYTKAMCDPIRELVEREGIKMDEKVL